MNAPTNARELWGHDVERDVGAIWDKLHMLRLVSEGEIHPHRRGLLECRELIDTLLGGVAS
tara:strand:+ start:293 stop:475 length:183 start_codon:yes stop_codon:yes gene_type:complete